MRRQAPAHREAYALVPAWYTCDVDSTSSVRSFTCMYRSLHSYGTQFEGGSVQISAEAAGSCRGR